MNMDTPFYYKQHRHPQKYPEVREACGGMVVLLSCTQDNIIKETTLNLTRLSGEYLSFFIPKALGPMESVVGEYFGKVDTGYYQLDVPVSL